MYDLPHDVPLYVVESAGLNLLGARTYTRFSVKFQPKWAYFSLSAPEGKVRENLDRFWSCRGGGSSIESFRIHGELGDGDGV